MTLRGAGRRALRALPAGLLALAAAAFAPGALAQTVSFSAATHEVTEGGVARVEVRLSTTRGQPTTVTLTAAATSTATAGKDYYGRGTWTVTIGPGGTRATARISTRQDNVLETNGERIDLTISSVSGGVVIGTENTARVDIVDDEFTFCFSNQSHVVREDAGEAVVTATMTRPAARTMHWYFRYQDLDARAKADYTPVHATAASALVVEKGQETVVLRIPIVDDAEKETTEVLRLHIERPVLPDDVTECRIDILILDNDTPAVSIERDVSKVAEGTEATYTLTARPAPAAPLEVNLTVTDAPGADYVGPADQGARTVTLGTDGTASVSVPTQPDTNDEPSGPVTVTVGADTASPRTYNVGSPSTASVTVSDDGDVPATVAAFAQAASSAAEDAGTQAVRVNLSPAPAQALTLAYTVTGTATAGTDFTIASSGTVQVAANAASVDIPVVLRDDAAAEDAETVVLTLGTGTGYRVGRPGAHTLNLADDDRTGLVFTPAALTVAEGASATYTVRLSSRPSADVTVTVTGHSGTDLTVDTDAVTGGHQATLTFTPSTWSTPQPVAVAAGTDTDTTDDTVTLLHSASGGDYGSVTGTVRVTVADDGKPLAYLFAAGGATHDLPEGAERGLGLALRTRLSPSRTATYPLTLGGTAARGGDYSLRCGSAAGVTCRNLGGAAPALVVDGAVLNGARSVPNVLFLSASADTNTESRKTVTLRLDDRTLTVGIVDAPATTTVAFTLASLSVPENLGPGQPILRVNPPFGKPITVPFTVTGNADAGVDYEALSSFTIPAGAAVAVVDIYVLDDLLLEGDESVVIAIDAANLPAGVSAGATATHTLTIVDEDRAGLVFTPAALDVAEGASASYTVRLGARPTGAVTVTVASDNGDVTLDTDPDTPGDQATLAFTPGSWNEPQTVAVTAYDDDDTADDTAALAHSASGGGYGSATGKVTVTVVDDDDATARLTAPPGTRDLPEGVEWTLGLALSGALSASRTRTYPLTLGGTAVRGRDYRLRCAGAPGVTCSTLGGDAPALVVDGAVLKGATSVKNVLLLSATEDGRAESRETVTLRLGGRTLTVRIVDAPAATTVAFASAGSGVAEDAGPGQPAYRVNPPFGKAITVPVTLAGTAARGMDYAAFSAFTIPAGTAQGTFDVDLLDDQLLEGDETVVIAIDAANLPAGVSAGTPATHTLTITDDDMSGLVLTPTTVNVAEGGSERYTVRLSRRPTGPVTVTVTSGNGDVTVDTDPDTSGDQATLAFTPANWHRPQTVTVAAAGDADGTDDTAALVHSASGGGYGAATGTVTVTVLELGQRVVVSVAPGAPVTEGAAAEFVVTVRGGFTGTLRATLRVADAPHADFVASGDEGVKTVILDNSRTAVLTVPTHADTVDEPSGPVTVTVVPQAAYRAGPPASVRVEDDDRTEVVLTVPDAWADERDARDTAALALTLNRGLVAGERLAVPLALAGGTVGTDFTLALAGRVRRGVGFSGTTVTFDGTPGAPSSTSATVRLTARADADDDDETVTVSIPRTASTDPMADPTTTLTASGLDGGVVGTHPTGTPPVTIVDTDVTVTAVVADPVLDTTGVPEGATFRATIVLSRALRSDETASYAIAFGGTAARGTDYRVRCGDRTGVTCRNLDGAAPRIAFDGAQTGRSRYFPLEIELLEDATVEAKETVTLRVGGATLAFAIVDAPATTTIGFKTAASVASEDNSPAQVLFTADPPFGRDVTVPVTVGGTATAGADYRAFSSFTIKAGQGASAFAVLLINDEVPEDDETVVIAMDTSNLPQGVMVGADSITETTVTILDHDAAVPGLTLSSASLALTEGADGSVTVRLATRPSGTVTVTVASDNADVTVDTDPATNGAQSTLTFNTISDEWSRAQAVTVAAAHDPDGVNDTATLTLSASGADHDGKTTTVAVTVTDDDAANLLVDPAALTVGEGAGGQTTVRLATQPTAPVTVTVASDNGDVTVDTDPATDGAQSSLTFNPSGADLWSTAQAVAVAAAHDPDGANDTATLTLSASGGGYGAKTATVAVTVTDDDAANLVIDPAALTVNEEGEARVAVRLATQPSGPVTVTVASDNPEVTVDTDPATDGAQGTLTFHPSGADPWSTAQAVTVTAAEDADDADDAATLTLSASGGGYGGVRGTVAVTVRDTPAVPSLSVSDGTVSEATANARGITKMRFRVSLSAPLERTVRAYLVTRDSTPVSARSRRDYPYTSYTITFRPGETERHVYVLVYGPALYDNAAVEGPETFEVVLRAADGTPVADGVGVGTITEGPMAPGVTVSRTRLALAEGGAAAHYSVAVNAPPGPGETVTVTVASEDPGAVRVHRGRGAPAPSTVLRFTAGGAWPEAQAVTVTAPGDADIDDERVRITHTVSGPGGWGGGLSAPPLTVAVADDDTARPVVSIAAGTSPVAEGTGAAFTVRVNEAQAAALGVNVDVTDAPGSDFVAARDEGRRTVTIPPGATSADFTVPTRGDEADEADGPVTAALGPGGGYALGTPASAAVTVRDDDGPRAGVAVSETALRLAEGGAAGTYTVALTTPPGAGETVTVVATVADAAVAQVRAGAGALAPSATLAFTAGNWSVAQTVTVVARDDADTGDERTQIAHTVSGPGPWGSVTVPAVALAVVDDDTVVRPTVWIEAASGAAVSEGSGVGFVVRADPAPASDLAVRMTVADAPGADFVAPGDEGARTVTIPAAQLLATFTVPTHADGDDEPSGGVTATPAAGDGYVVESGGGADAVRVRDDDATTVALAGPEGDIAEADGEKAFTVTLGRGLRDGEALDVALAFGGTATRGTDYTTTCPSPLPAGVACHDLDDVAADANPRVTFTGPAAGATAASVTLTLAAVDDAGDEGAGETVTVALGALDADSGTGLDGGATGTGALAFAIEDDDVPALSIAAASAEAVTEGTAVGFTVSADTAPAADLEVEVTVADAMLSDFLAETEEGARTVTLLAGETSAAFTVATQADTDDEPNGAVTATLAEGDGFTVVADAGTAAAGVADDDATAVTLAGPAGDIAEAGGAKTFTVTLARALVAGEALEVPLVLAGDADNGDDYAVTCATAKGVGCSGLDGASPRVAFTGGAGAASVATLTLASIDDETDEGAGETVTVDLGTLDADSGTGLGGGASGTGALSFQISDDDLPPPVVTIAVSPASMVEGGRATFTVRADRAPDLALSVPVTVADAPGADFIAQAEEGRRTVTIGAGATSAAFAFTTDDDAVDEPDGPVTATLATGEGYTLGSPAEAAVRVADDDQPTLPTLSIADAEAQEGKQLRFTITLSAPLDRDARFTVRFQESHPVSARASYDWDTRRFCQCTYDFITNRFNVTLRRGETEAHRWVSTVDDAHDEGDETFEGHIIWADVPIARRVAVGTIRNDDPLPAAWLARFGRTVASQAVDALTDRMAAPRTPGFEGTLAGQALPGGVAGAEDHGTAANDPETRAALAGIAQGFGAGDGRFGGAGPFDGERMGGGFSGTGAQERSMSGREVLLGSRFALTGAADASGGTLALWGRAAQDRFEGVESGDGTDIRLDGEVTTALLGTDYAQDRWLVGLALVQSTAEGAYESEGAGDVCPPAQEGGETPVLCDGAVRAGDGTLAGSLTAAVPYAAVQASERLKLWGAAGYGAGEVTLETALGDRYPADTTWTMAAVGMRGELLTLSSGPSLALTSDAFWARTASEKTRELAASESDVTRLRLGLEGAWPVSLAGGASLAPTLETGLRHDGGDAETGFGVELGGGLAWSDPGLGLVLDLSGRTLLAHEDAALEDRGYAASLVFDPRPSSARGLTLSLGQTLGTPSGGLDALFAPDPLAERTGAEATPRWTAEAVYGRPALGGRFTASPHVGFGLATDTRDWTLGWRLTPEGETSFDFAFDVKAVRTESDAAAPEHTLGVELRAAW